ncbi:hypothetical protein KAS08_04760 [Candidatus Pacearchaeota archaeon]|nr:hypothetical protein [Candidatus Pacearchaeota archaeon]
MGIPIREHTLEAIEDRLNSMNTALNKINYLESALTTPGFSFELKRFLFGMLANLYEERKMFERAAKSMSDKANVEVGDRERIDSYVNAAELYSKAGKIRDADEMFSRAIRNTTPEGNAKVKLARKNIYFAIANELERRGRKASAIKFYEKLIKMNLEDIDKKDVKEKLISTYNCLGMFREAKLLSEQK